MAAPIPSRLVFIWFGRRLPTSGVVALRSAMRVCRPEETLLLHEGLDTGSPGVRSLVEEGLRLEPASTRWFDGLPPGGDVARRLFIELESPASRANLLRLAFLWQRGGVYLDTDTITVKDLALLREHRGFCGQEPVALPGGLVGSLHPLRWAAAGLRLLARDVCARLPDGPDRFRRIENLYAWAVNNAVLAACPRNALLTDAFSVIAAMPAARQRRRFALGTHLLQRLTSNRSSRDMEVLPPAYFYPLGPEISVHWFRDDSARRLRDLLAPETHVVHWYSSVEERVGIRSIDEEWILAHRDSSAFARLAAPYLDGP